MCEGMPIRFKKEGFQRLADVVRWCAEDSIYAVLDMRAAPGGRRAIILGLKPVPKN